MANALKGSQRKSRGYWVLAFLFCLPQKVSPLWTTSKTPFKVNREKRASEGQRERETAIRHKNKTKTSYISIIRLNDSDLVTACELYWESKSTNFFSSSSSSSSSRMVKRNRETLKSAFCIFPFCSISYLIYDFKNS